MSNRDQRMRSLFFASLSELGSPKFRHHDIDLMPRRRDAGTGLQQRRNSRHALTFDVHCRGKADQRSAAVRERGPGHEIQMPTDTRVLAPADAISNKSPAPIGGVVGWPTRYARRFICDSRVTNPTIPIALRPAATQNTQPSPPNRRTASSSCSRG